MTPPRSFKDRLYGVLAAGNLTIMDLARWFDRPYASVRQWTRGTTMSGPPGDNEEVLRLLTKLEFMIHYKKGFPVPHLRPRDRVIYLAKLRKRAG